MKYLPVEDQAIEPIFTPTVDMASIILKVHWDSTTNIFGYLGNNYLLIQQYHPTELIIRHYRLLLLSSFIVKKNPNN